ncbi:alpha-L-rhamnosidase C-terminal domain-containing protein [Paenibacillus mendelii]|uniref:Alpha-L-rhamnosidase C-terminal domain-containing protein n=1 Tax=Paenibacillus mendelii TaxID=206163 RepID=A0ABV6J7D8_9BACL|nr:alpha-L-rhamnosidase C-terminal domain-containing protein [Paenibacillus mendelii]MCQ6562137.1 alpha-L-rhamnosidase [Paenibacillus mendelii]
MLTASKVNPALVPSWIWHPERADLKQIQLSKTFHLESDLEGLELSLACTGAADAAIDGVSFGSLEDHPRHGTMFTKLTVPFKLSKGEHTISISVSCSQPMPVVPISIHLVNRTVGCIAYLQGEGLWLVTDATWRAGDRNADVVCLLGEEPYGDLDHGAEWFVAGGYGDMTTEPVQQISELSSSRLNIEIRDSLIELKGKAEVDFHFEAERNERHLFYHLLKQNEWKIFRTAQNQTDLSSTPTAVIDLNKELNVRFRLRNHNGQPLSLLLNGAESLHELEHYDSCITEYIQIPGNGEYVTLPQGMRYVQIFVGGASGQDIEMEIECEAVGVPLEQIGSIQTNLPVLDQIFEVSAHTNKVCHQVGLWDGIKRDRLNWAYDFYMAGKADYMLWDDYTILKRAIGELGDTPYGYWMNSIPSYTLWWVIGMWEYYLHTGDKAFVLEMKGNLQTHVKWVEDNVDKQTGHFYNPSQAFIEWVPMNEQESWACLNAILKLMKSSVQSLVAYVPELELNTDWPDPVFDEEVFLQDDSALITPLIGILCGYVSDERAIRFLDGYQVQDPITPLSAYWLAECYSKYERHQEAWEVIAKVWGSMLNDGATTFWESVVMSPQSDYHDSQTTYTNYNSYRMSLCHSWASTPVTWISKFLIGVQPAKPGYEEIHFQPNAIQGLTECQGTISTPRGPLAVEWNLKDGVMEKTMHFVNE